MRTLSRRTTPALLLASTMLTALAAPALAQERVGQLEEVVVTAQKRSENMQDVPISIQALGAERLDELQVSDFADYAKFLPNVSIQSIGPGFSTVYMRGVASGENNNHSGPLPSVGIYLDEQPITTITGALDVHVYDIDRVEVLAGPQGTLYGASSQAGTIRIISNKPTTDGFSASYDLELNRISHGEVGYGFEGYVNQPLGDRAAIRAVGWAVHDGGYIDNELATRTYPTGPVTIDNADLVEDDYNDVDTVGARAALQIDLDENWTITPALMGQRTQADGAFAVNPSFKGYKINRFRPERSDDKWAQAALTIQGTLSNLDVVYAGAYLKRWVDTEQDYTDYSYFYDTVAGYGAYWVDNAGNPNDISQYIQGKDYYTKQSHELRVSTPTENRLHAVAGLFYQKQTHNIQQRYRIDNLADATEVPGWPDTLWLTKQLRTDRDYAAFIDGTFDITDRLAITGGIRFFKSNNSLEGFFGFGTGYSSGTGVGGCTGPAIVEGGPCTNVDKSTKETGETYRVNAQYKLADDKMIYATYSTGFRPGGINRRGTLPPYKSDFLTNLEAGWKTSWGGRLRWNGAVFSEKWDDFQFSIVGLNGLTEIRNAGQAKMRGIETDINWLVVDGFTLVAAAAYTKAELNEDYVPRPADPPAAVKGTSLPVTPKLKGNLVARYEWDVSGDMEAHVQGAVVYTGPNYPDLQDADRAVVGQIPASTTFDFTTGVSNGSWRMEAYVKNLFDEDGQVDRGVQCNTAVCSRVYVSLIRPRTIGLRFGQSF